MLCSSLWGWTWTPWLQSRRLVCETRKIHPSVHWRIGPHPGRSAFIWCKKSKSPSALLEMVHAFSRIRNFCRKQGCWGGFLYHPHIIWGPAGFVFVQSVSIDLNFSWWVLTSLPPLEGLLFIPPKASELIVLAISWNIGPSTRNPLFLHPSHSIHLVVLAVPDLLTCCSTMDLSHPKPEGSDSQPSERVALQHSSSFLQVH